MKMLFQTNDAVLLSFAEALLFDAGLAPVILDSHTSVLEGSLGVLPRRLCVEDGQWDHAMTILREAELNIEA